MVIEILKPKDLKSYKELIDECFGTSNDLEKYQKYKENQAYKIFVVKEGNTIIGSATQYTVDLFTFDFQPCLMLFNVAVRTDYREKQIAKYLLAHIIEYARNWATLPIYIMRMENLFAKDRMKSITTFAKKIWFLMIREDGAVIDHVF